jgi:hypothetical protein
MIKALVIIVFLLIIISLGFALFNLMTHKPGEQSEKTVKALTFRIALSVALFIFIFIAIVTGMFKPHGIGAQIQMQKSVTGHIESPKNH